MTNFRLAQIQTERECQQFSGDGIRGGGGGLILILTVTCDQKTEEYSRAASEHVVSSPANYKNNDFVHIMRP